MLCVPGEQGETVGIGSPASLGGDEDATVEEVELIGAEGLEVSAAYVLPGGTDDMLGAFHPDIEESESWTLRADAAGRVLQAGETVNIVAVVSRDGAGAGTATAIRVTYEIQGVRHEAETTTGIEIRDHCDTGETGGAGG